MAQTLSIPEQPYQPWQGWKLYLGFFLGFATLYIATAQRSVAWQDSGVFQWRILQFDPRGQWGIALAHPLLIILGRMLAWLPAGHLAWRMNLVSALGGAMAVANVALLVRRLAPQPRAAAWVAGGAFGLAHTTWWLATICESQALHVALFTLALHAAVSLVRCPGLTVAILAGLLNGLAFSTHGLALLALPGLGLLVLVMCIRRRLSWLGLGGFVLGWLLGALSILVLVAEMVPQSGLIPAVRSALFGASWESNVLGGSGRAVANGSLYMLYNFPNLTLPLAVIGLVSLWRLVPRMLAWLLAYMTAIYFVFAIRYTVVDQFMFFLPIYAMLAVLAGLGLARLTQDGRRPWLTPVVMVLLAATPVIYAAAPAIWQAAKLPLPGRRDLPYRDAARYWLTPWKQNEDSAADFARAALDGLPEGSVIAADTTSMIPLKWQILQTGQDVAVVEEIEPGEIIPGFPKLFIVSVLPGYHPQWLDAVAHFEPRENKVLYRVVWDTPASSARP